MWMSACADPTAQRPPSCNRECLAVSRVRSSIRARVSFCPAGALYRAQLRRRTPTSQDLGAHAPSRVEAACTTARCVRFADLHVVARFGHSVIVFCGVDVQVQCLSPLGVILDDEFCMDLPPSTVGRCNEFSCDFKFVLGTWGSCNAVCGGGKRYRTYTCQDSFGTCRQSVLVFRCFHRGRCSACLLCGI